MSSSEQGGLEAARSWRVSDDAAIGIALFDQQRRIGQDLHDGLGQHLTALGMLAERLLWKLKADASPHVAAAAELVDLLDEAKQQVRRVVKGLHPVDVDAVGLMSALDELTRATELHAGVSCVLLCDEAVAVQDNNTATQLFHIAQEAVNNAVKHAQAEQIVVRLQGRRGGVSLQVLDDGVGVRSGGTGMGFRIMRHRADVIGAAFSVTGRDRSGTIVSCTVKENGSRGTRPSQTAARPPSHDQT